LKLLLFDIDGTLLRVAETGREILTGALASIIGRPIKTTGIRFSGRTDIPIIREVLVKSGCSIDEAEELLPSATEAYKEHGLRLLERPGSVRVLPGVPELLAILAARDDVLLGLVTGNIREMAYAKLSAAGLADYFAFGAFGSDHEERHRLPPLALRHAETQAGRRFSGKDVVIIGDTEFDVLCGKALGVFAVAVATGRFDRSYLSAYEPDLLLDDLRNVEGFLNSVVEPG
jgi:phosphoglycolate phosphatase-like HAD superfamily hydrolase